jgi:DNA-3-methyladenine glycosylase II
MTEREIDLQVSGRFDLRQSIGFGFGQRAADESGSVTVMRLAFCLDGLERQVGVAVRQPEPSRLVLEVIGDVDTDLVAVRAQVARVLSVDLDGSGYDELGRTDPAVGRIQAARPGLRPPLFYSAYEAALWGILSARQPAAQMFAAREQMSRRHGRVFVVAGQELAAAPLPAELTEVTELSGVREVKLSRLQGLGTAALAGALDTETLRALDPEEAARQLQQLAGIGPFYAELITARALGHADVLATREPRIRKLAAHLIGRSEPLSDTDFDRLADTWRPWRTWVAVALRAGATELGYVPSA